MHHEVLLEVGLGVAIDVAENGLVHLSWLIADDAEYVENAKYKRGVSVPN